MRFRRSRPDYPKGVLGIYDRGERCFDRFTVVYEPEQFNGVNYFPILGMSRFPFHPQGYCQHAESRFRLTRWECGRTMNFGDLPEPCRKAVMQDLEEWT